MRLIILNEKFYSDYSQQRYPEILEKRDRPYYCLSFKVDGQTFAIPLRHHINHPFAFFTIGKAGIDYTKAIVLKGEYVSPDIPWIDSRQYAILNSQESRSWVMASCRLDGLSKVKHYLSRTGASLFAFHDG